MTISVGSYADLRGDQPKPIDRNPLVDCHCCGESYLYQDYWVPRYVDGKSWNPGEVVWWCDECLERVSEEYRLVKRKRENKQLSEYSNHD